MKNSELKFYSNLNKDDLEKSLLELIQAKNHYKVRHILKNTELRSLIDIDYAEGVLLRTACKIGDIKTVKMLLTIPYNGEYPNVSINRNGINSSSPLMEACFINDIEIVKYLITTKTVEKNVIPELQMYNALLMAISLGNLDMVKVFLDSPKILPPLNMDNHYEESLRRLVTFYDKSDDEQKEKLVQILKYLLDIYKKEKRKIHEIDDEFFETLLGLYTLRADRKMLKEIYYYYNNDQAKIEEAIMHAIFAQNTENAKYFLIEEGFKVSEYTRRSIYNTNNEIKLLLEKIKLNEKLNLELSNDDDEIKKEKL